MTATQPLPTEVSDDEKLARAVFDPYHLDKKGNLKAAAFRAPAERKDVSVNRLLALSATDCKVRAKEMEVPGKTYKGFAVIRVKKVRECGSDVVDSRVPPEGYFGHADIIHPFTLPKNEPAPPSVQKCLQKMASYARYFADPDPTQAVWSGGDL